MRDQTPINQHPPLEPGPWQGMAADALFVLALMIFVLLTMTYWAWLLRLHGLVL